MDKGTALVNNLRNEKEGNKKEGNKKDVYKAFADYYSWADGVIKEQYEKGVLTIHFRQEDRTERIIYNTQTKSATLFGKQRRGYYYPWVGYNGQGNCSTIYKK